MVLLMNTGDCGEVLLGPLCMCPWPCSMEMICGRLDCCDIQTYESVAGPTLDGPKA